MCKKSTLDQHFRKCAKFSTLFQKHSQGVDIVIEMTDDYWQQMNAQADAIGETRMSRQGIIGIAGARQDGLLIMPEISTGHLRGVRALHGYLDIG